MMRKDFAVEILDLISAGRLKDGLRFFAPDCKAHNPHVTGGMNALIDAMVDVKKKGAEGIIKGSRADFKLDVRLAALTTGGRA
jgi:predicted SnoaL-like aldol condensation-catalyzing enzyme